MAAIRSFSPASRRLLIRPAIALLLALGFILVARQIEPGDSHAGESGSLGDPLPQTPHTAPLSSGKRTLGTLTGGGYTIEILPGPDGPRYTVRNEQGDIIADNATEDMLYRIAPDLDLSRWSATGPVMLVEPEDH